MTKMPPPSYLTLNRPGQRLQFPRPGDSSLFENSGRRHYQNYVIFSTPYALFQDDKKSDRNINIILPSSRNIKQANTNKQEISFKKNNYLDDDYHRMKKEKDALDRQVINLKLNRQSHIYSRSKQTEIQFSYAQKHQNIEKQYIRRIQVNMPPKNSAQYSSIQPKQIDYYPPAQQISFKNQQKINRQRIKTQATQMPQQQRNSTLNRNVRFNPTYLSWIN